jgi:ABC-type transporter MlaC component
LKLKWFPIIVAGALLFGLAGCGPGDVNSATGSAVATANAVVPSGAQATAAAVAGDATVQALANGAAATIAAAASDPGVQSAVDQAFSSINDRATITQGQALTLSALSSVQNVQNWRMTIVDAPQAAAASKGKVVKEASGGNISLSPEEYNKYFTAPGDYKVKLDVTTSDNKTASHEFTVTVPS